MAPFSNLDRPVRQVAVLSRDSNRNTNTPAPSLTTIFTDWTGDTMMQRIALICFWAGLGLLLLTIALGMRWAVRRRRAHARIAAMRAPKLTVDKDAAGSQQTFRTMAMPAVNISGPIAAHDHQHPTDLPSQPQQSHTGKNAAPLFVAPQYHPPRPYDAPRY